MRKTIVLAVLIFSSGMAVSQKVTEAQTGRKLEYKDKSEIKGAGEIKKEEAKVEKTPQETVIIQRLEYKAEEVPAEGVAGGLDGKVHFTGSQGSNEQVKSTDEQILDLDAYILAIDKKIAWAKSNPEENLKAYESGWYDQMAKAKADAVTKRNALIQDEK